MDANFSEARNYTILPATAVNPRNVRLEPMTHPPPFMPTVREMRKRYVTRKGNINDVNEKKAVQKWKTENKNIHGTKVVWKFFVFPGVYVLFITLE